MRAHHNLIIIIIILLNGVTVFCGKGGGGLFDWFGGGGGGGGGGLWDLVIGENGLGSWFQDDEIMDMIRHYVEQFRYGLINANVDQLSAQNVTIMLKGNNLDGSIKTLNTVVYGLTDFRIKNLNASLSKKRIDVDVQMPLKIDGNYKASLNLLGIPLLGDGKFSLTVVTVDIGGGACMIFGAENGSIAIYNPMVSVQDITITFDGFLFSMTHVHLILMILGSAVVAFGSVIFLTLYFSGSLHKVTDGCRRYQAVQ